jgi:hypothetical protein
MTFYNALRRKSSSNAIRSWRKGTRKTHGKTIEVKYPKEKPKGNAELQTAYKALGGIVVSRRQRWTRSRYQMKDEPAAEIKQGYLTELKRTI